MLGTWKPILDEISWLNLNAVEDVNPALIRDLDTSIGVWSICWAQLFMRSWSWQDRWSFSSEYSRTPGETLSGSTDVLSDKSSKPRICLATYPIVGWSNSSVLGRVTSNVWARELQSSIAPSESRPLFARISFEDTWMPVYSVTKFATLHSTSVYLKGVIVRSPGTHAMFCENWSNIESFEASDLGSHNFWWSKGDIIRIAFEGPATLGVLKWSRAKTPSSGLRTPKPWWRIFVRTLLSPDVIPSKSSPHAPHWMLKIGVPTFCINSANSSITPFAIA